MIGKGGNVDATIVIIIGSVAVGIIAVPLFGFLIFHIYLSLSGKTTREMIKKIDSKGNDVNSEHNFQWCSVDNSLINFYENIS